MAGNGRVFVRVAAAELLFVPNVQIARADSILGSVAAGTNPNAVAVNPVTNKIYVANEFARM